jgi:hypothetical protein
MGMMKRTIASAVAAVGIGAAATVAGVATQPAVPASPVTLAAAADDNDDAGAESVAILNSYIDPEGWAKIVGDGS